MKKHPPVKRSTSNNTIEKNFDIISNEPFQYQEEQPKANKKEMKISKILRTFSIKGKSKKNNIKGNATENINNNNPR